MNETNYIVYPEFAESPIPIKLAAKVMGTSERVIRERMEAGTFDIGVSFRCSRRRGEKGSRSTYISPKKFWELTGYVWSKEKEALFKETQ